MARKLRHTRGFTLLEMMISITVLASVMGMLYTLALSLGEAARMQEVKVSTQDEARVAAMGIIRELRQARGSSINWNQLPGTSLTYQIAIDADGNGYAVDVNGDIELSTVRTLSRDVNDMNQDGETNTQLVITQTTNGVTTTRVLANDLLVDEDTNNSGGLDAGEDLNNNGVLDRGIWFQQVGSAVQLTVQAQRLSSVRGHRVHSSLTELVAPRN
jgi:prepilin-type N-terminal cleavage/methylation domain-containing protein